MKKSIDSKTGIALVVGIALIVIIIYLIAMNSGGTAPSFPPTATSTTETATPAPTSKTAAPAPAKQTTASKPKAATIVVGVGSLTDLSAMKKVMYCSISTTTGVKKSGTVYVVPGMYRANLSNTVSMIDNGKRYYAWLSGATTGLELTKVSAAGSVLASRGALDPSATLSYSCYAWTEDASYFVPPAAITFTNTSGL